jgi:uncharacterized protein (TIGR02145 family)
MTVSGAGTLTLNAKDTRLWLQNATMSDCGKTMYDNRSTAAYKTIAYTTAKIENICWMTRNLDLPGGTTITSADSNVSSNYTLPASNFNGWVNIADDNKVAIVYNSNSTNCAQGSACYSYYSWRAATAGYNAYYNDSVQYDICPKGWHLPTMSEASTLAWYHIYNSVTATDAPFKGVLSGQFDVPDYAGPYGNPGGGGQEGRCWTSSSSSDTSPDISAYYFSYYNGTQMNVYTGYRRFGMAVRCVKT